MNRPRYFNFSEKTPPLPAETQGGRRTEPISAA